MTLSSCAHRAGGYKRLNSAGVSAPLARSLRASILKLIGRVGDGLRAGRVACGVLAAGSVRLGLLGRGPQLVAARVGVACRRRKRALLYPAALSVANRNNASLAI